MGPQIPILLDLLEAFGIPMVGVDDYEADDIMATFSVKERGPTFVATGDRDPDDTRSQSFQNMLPSQHDKYGVMDFFSWRNLHDARVLLTARPAKTLDASLSYHAYWLAETSDYWFRSNGISTQRTTTPDGRDVRRIGASSLAGQEIDVVVKWSAAEWLKVEAGYSHFFAGDYLRDIGPSDDADFGYVMTTVKF